MRKSARAQTVQLFAETQTAPAIGGLVLSLSLNEFTLPPEVVLFEPAPEDIHRGGTLAPHGKTGNRLIFLNVPLLDFEQKALDKLHEALKNEKALAPGGTMPGYVRLHALRLLQQAKWKVEKAINTIATHLEMRVQKMPVREDAVLNDLQTAIMYWHGRDRSCRPILVWRMEKVYALGLDADRATRMILFILEYAVRYLLVPVRVENWVLLVDLTGCGLSMAASSTFRSITRNVTKLFPLQPAPNTQPSHSQPSTAVSSRSTVAMPQPRVQPTPPVFAGLRWLGSFLSPFRLVWSFISNLTTQVLNYLSGSAHLIEAAPGSTPGRRFLSFYESRYGTEHPDFFDGSYQAALAAAGQQLKFVIVYIHSESHRLTPSFCRTVLAHSDFISTANESFIFWTGSITQREPAAVYHALRAPALPYLAVVAAPPNRSTQPSGAASQSAQGAFGDTIPPFSRANYGTVLSQRAGPPAQASGGESTAQWLQRVFTRHAPMLDAIRIEREERESARLLRQQQDEEYAAALAADRRAEQEEEERKKQEQKELDRLDELEVRRERKRIALGEEPDKGPGIASIVIRLPDGSRVGRRFAQTDVLEKVFDWAEVNRVDIEVANLVVAFPRRSFRYPEDATLTISEAGLFPSGMLLLEERGE